MEDVIVLGCGALGSRLAMEVATVGVSMRVLDFDVVDNNNVLTGTTIYKRQHVGAAKAPVLAAEIYRRTGTRAWADTRRLTSEVVEEYNYFQGARMVLDCFDNIPARALTTNLDAPTLHVAVSPFGTGVVAWNDRYDLPEDIPGGTPVCTHQLGRRLLMWTASVAAQSVLEFLETGRTRSFVTGRNFQIWG